MFWVVVSIIRNIADKYLRTLALSMLYHYGVHREVLMFFHVNPTWKQSIHYVSVCVFEGVCK